MSQKIKEIKKTCPKNRKNMLQNCNFLLHDFATWQPEVAGGTYAD